GTAGKPLIRCARCVASCPMNLMPLKFAAYAKAKKFEEAKALDMDACFEYGACAYRCPAKINIVAAYSRADDDATDHACGRDSRTIRRRVHLELGAVLRPDRR
ncbi:MAG: 4Fe-4S dicluster domain-containing protein, partial [Spirochaetaceae bacterium]